MHAPVDIGHRSYQDTMAACAERGGARLVVTSPPYLDSRAKGHYGFDCPAWTFEDYERLGQSILAGLCPGGVCALNIYGRVAKWRKAPFGTERSTTWMRVALAWQDMGFRYLECYAYGREGVPGLFGPRHRSGWEPVHVFARPGGDVAFNPSAVTTPAIHPGHHKSSTHRCREGIGHRRAYTQPALRNVTTLLSLGTVGQMSPHFNNDHPAAFDARLADLFVLSYSNPGDLVCDPFVGSGTTAVVARRSGRVFVGGDLGARVVDGARWSEVATQRAIASTPDLPSTEAP